MLISVIIPTKDRRDAVLNAVASLYAGEYADFEVFVIDQSAGSETRDALGEFSGRQGFHCISNHKPNVGAASSRNIGIALSSGDVVTIIDDDVTARRDYLAQIAEEFKADPKLQFICGKLTAPPYDWQMGYTPNFDAPPNLPKYRMPIDAAGANFSMRRSLFDKIGGYDEYCGPGSRLGASDDGDIAWRIVRSGAKWKACPNVEVEHTFGFRPTSQGESLLKRYQLGLGGNFGRFVRRGDLVALAYFAQWQIKDILVGCGRLVQGRSDNGLGWVRDRMIGFARGLALSEGHGFVRGRDLNQIKRELLESADASTAA